MNFFSARSNTFNFIFLFILAFFIRLFFIIYFGFDGLYGQDAYAYADSSELFYHSLISCQIPQNFYWPVGFYSFASLMSLLMGGYSDTAALLVSLNAGALTAGFMYLFAFEAFAGSEHRKRAAFIAGLIISFAGITLKSSILIMADALGLMFLTISAYYLARYTSAGTRASLLLCFITFSAGLITRYANGLFLIVIFIVLVYVFLKSPNRKKIVIDLYISAIAGIIIYLPQAYYIFNYGIPYLQFEGEHATWAASWNALNMFSRDFMTFDGTKHYRLWNGLFYISPVFHPMFLSLFGLTFLYGIYNLITKRRYFLMLLCLSWIAVYYFYLAGNPFQSIRYTMSFFPPLILVSAWGLAELNIRRAYKSAFTVICFLLLLGYGYYDIYKQVQRKNKELETIDWISKNVPLNAKLFTFDITGALNHYTKRNARELFSCKYNELAGSIDSSGGSVYMVIPLKKIKTQWKGLPLEKNLDSLQANYKFIPIGSINEFDGFSIEKTGAVR